MVVPRESDGLGRSGEFDMSSNGTRMPSFSVTRSRLLISQSFGTLKTAMRLRPRLKGCQQCSGESTRGRAQHIQQRGGNADVAGFFSNGLQ
jgi:hypothetical protein